MSRRFERAMALTVWCIVLVSVLAAAGPMAVPVLGEGGPGGSGGAGAGTSSRDLAFGDWNVTSSEKHDGQNISVTGNLTVTGNLELSNCTLTFATGGGEVRTLKVNGSGSFYAHDMRFAVSDRNGSFHIIVSDNGWLDIIRSTFSGLKGTPGHASIEGKGGSGPFLVLVGTVIAEAVGTVVSWTGGYCDISNNTISLGPEGSTVIAVGGTRATIRDNYVDASLALGDTVGISFNGTMDAVTSRNLIMNVGTAMLATSSSIQSTGDRILNAVTGISLKDSYITFVNLSVEGSTTAIDADESTVMGSGSNIVSNGMDMYLTASTAEMVSVTYDEAILNESSMLTRSWSLDVSVRDLVDQPVPGASVVLTSAIGTVKYNGTTGEHGRMGPIALDAYIEDGTGVTSFTPYEMAVSRGALYEDVGVVLDRDRSVDVSMGGPDVMVTSVYLVGEPSINVPAKVRADLETGSPLTPPFNVFLQDGDTYIGNPVLFDFSGELTGSLEFDWTPGYSGDHLLTVRADPENTLQNQDTDNNRMVVSVYVADGGGGGGGGTALPDLTVQGIAFDKTVGDIADLEVVKVTVTIQNLGTADAGPFKACFYVDKKEIDCKTIAGLKAGITVYQTFSWTAATGEHVFGAEVDVDHGVQESNELNNRVEQKTNIGSTDWSTWLCIGGVVIGIVIFILVIVWSIKKASAAQKQQQQQQQMPHPQPPGQHMPAGQYSPQQYEHTPYGHSSYGHGPPTGPQPQYGPGVQSAPMPQYPPSSTQTEPEPRYEPLEPTQIDHQGAMMAELKIQEGIPVGALTNEEKYILSSKVVDDRRPRKKTIPKYSGGPTVELLQCPRCGNEDVQPFEQGYRKCRACGKVFFLH